MGNDGDSRSAGNEESVEVSAADTSEGAQTGLTIIGVGASAGGLESIEQFFRDLDESCNAAFVVVQHLSPDFKSFMPEILSKKTPMRVQTATDGMLVQANSIYLTPPRMNMVISNGALRLSDIERTRVPNKPIDLFFSSMAHDIGDAAVAVVLSGTGSDGSLGILDVHRAGGRVFAESMTSAKFDGMPSAAIATGIVDGEGTPRQIAAEIFGRKYDSVDHPETLLNQELMGGKERAQIFSSIEARYGVDFARYKIATVNRRIDRRISELSLRSIKQYWQYIQDHPQEVTTLYYEMLIGVTDFFRDPEAFEEIHKEIAGIVEAKQEGEEIRVWSAGCASGEEIYSLGILFMEEMKRQDRQINLKIFATDIDDEILGRAASGVYQEDQMASIPEGLRRTYFTSNAGSFRVSPALRSRIVFARHNVMNDPPFTKLDMIVCRNLLIYLDNDTQKQVLSLFYFSLNPNAILFLGPSESLGKYETGYDIIHSKWKIFSKSKHSLPSAEINGTAERPGREFPVLATPSRSDLQAAGRLSRGSAEDAYHALLQQYVPPSLLVDENQNLLHVYGDLPFSLSFKAGKISNNLRAFLDDTLCTAISVCMQRAKRDRKPAEYTRYVLHADKERTVDFRVTPVAPRARDHINFFLISFEERESDPSIPVDNTIVVDRNIDLEQVSVLEEELQNTKEHLQSTIEELETTNEELQSTNEELLASNEELQSTNEELHSVNEELYTVNAEYQSKITELNQLSTDEAHLFESTGVGMVFFDRNIRVRKFTPAAANLFNLLSHDVGRPFEHVTHSFDDVNFSELLGQVLQDEESIEMEMTARDGVPYLAQLMPYYDSNDELDGAVVSLVSIRAIKAAEQVYFNILEASPVGIIGLSHEGSVISVNAPLLLLLGFQDDVLTGQPVDRLFDEEQDLELLRQQIANQSGDDSNGKHLKPVSLAMQHRTGREIRVEISVRKVSTVEGPMVHLFVMDMTERHEYLSALESHRSTLEKEVLARTAELSKRNAEYEDLYENSPDMFATVDATTGRITKCNNQLASALGYAKSELIGMPAVQLYPEDLQQTAALALQQFLKTGRVPARETVLRTHDGQRISVLLNVNAVTDASGDVREYRASWTDVSDVYLLQAENTTFLLATQGSDIGIWDWDIATGEQHWSAKFYELLGYVDANAPVLSFDADVVHPEDQQRLDAEFRHHFDNRERFNIEVRLRMASGDFRWFHLQGRAVRNSEGQPSRIVGSSRDIDSARKAVAELESQAAMFGFITEETNDGWWDWHLETDYEYMSDRFWLNFGIDPQTKKPHPSEWQELIHPADLQSTLENFNKHVESQGEHPYHQEVRYRHADGHWSTVICRGRVIEWANDGSPLRMVGVHTDITRLKIQEAQLKQVNQELIASNEELERFAYITSHDLKAPLRGISNLIEFIEADIEPALVNDPDTAGVVKQHFERLDRQARRMQGLIQGVLDYSRIDGIEPTISSVDVKELLSDIALDHQLALGKQLVLPENLPTIETDRVKLEQVFGNLISNASKFHPDPEQLRIDIGCQEKASPLLHFSVKDNGDGIEPQYHERIFDMFQTLNARDRFESTGVGLTVVRRIVQQFGGDISVESEAGAGATFHFTWPVSIDRANLTS